MPVHPIAQTPSEAPGVEARFVGVCDQVGQVQVVLAMQQQCVCGPERPLCRGGPGCLRGQECLRVDVAEREVTPDAAHLWVGGEQFPRRVAPVLAGGMDG